MITRIDILLVLFLILLGVGLKYSGKEIYDDYINPDYSLQLKGICALIIVFHHISQKLSGGLFVLIFQRVGCLAVAIFFLLSGYGLMKRFNSDSFYLNQFITKRMIRLGVPYIIYVFIIFAVMSCELFLRVENGISYSYLISWFIFSIAIMYFIFWLSYKQSHFGNTKLAILLVVYITVCIFLKLPGWWYNASFAFAIGVYMACYENRFKIFIRKKCWITLGLLLAIYEFLNIGKTLLAFQVLNLIVEIFTPSIFAMAIFVLGYKIQFRNPLWEKIGKLSMETYLINVLVIHLLYRQYSFFNDDLIYAVVCILVVYAIAIPMKEIDNKLSIKMMKLLGKN